MTDPFPRGTGHCSCPEASRPSVGLVAITGGPGAGKTAVIELARRAFCRHVAFIPEAAGIVFAGGFPRLASVEARSAAQRAIFHVQREMEGLVQVQADVCMAVCDRGTVDGLAYWPQEPDAYWQQVGTTHIQELARYRAVIHLRTPGADQGYNHINELRVESAEQAQRIDESILQAWAPHPHRHLVEASASFEDKAHRTLALLREEFRGCASER